MVTQPWSAVRALQGFFVGGVRLGYRVRGTKCLQGTTGLLGIVTHGLYGCLDGFIGTEDSFEYVHRVPQVYGTDGGVKAAVHLADIS